MTTAELVENCNAFRDYPLRAFIDKTLGPLRVFPIVHYVGEDGHQVFDDAAEYDFNSEFAAVFRGSGWRFFDFSDVLRPADRIAFAAAVEGSP